MFRVALKNGIEVNITDKDCEDITVDTDEGFLYIADEDNQITGLFPLEDIQYAIKIRGLDE